MPEKMIIKISADVGELTGTVKTYMAQQAETNKALFKLVDAHEKQIKDIVGVKNKVIGAAIFSAFSGAGVGSFIMKMFGKVHVP